MVQGSCLCGTVRYEIDGPFNMMMNCHCSMCRKHHGSAYATFASAPLEGFRWVSGEDRLHSYASSEKGKRSFCAVCGSVAPMLMPEMGAVIAPAGNLEGDLGIKPQSHVFAGSKAPWHTIADELPQFDEFPPEFGASGIPRPAVEHKAGVVQGSCLCGDVAYEVTGPALRMMMCHCSRCRRGRSAAHATNMFYPMDQFRWTRGESQVMDYKVPEAKFFAVAFCSRCGGGVPRPSVERKLVVVPAGSLDEDPGIQPQAHIFVSAKAPWMDIAGEVPQFTEMPPPA